MLKLRFEDLTPEASVAERLDVAVNRACAEFYLFSDEAIRTGSSVNPVALRARDLDLLRLVFVADARYRHDNSGIDNPIGWVSVAKDGMKRLGKEIKGAKGLEKTRIFSSTAETTQRKAYMDMCEHRMGLYVGKLALNDSYPAHVANGTIVVVSGMVNSRN
jgi:hypothetical protein